MATFGRMFILQLLRIFFIKKDYSSELEGSTSKNKNN